MHSHQGQKRHHSEVPIMGQVFASRKQISRAVNASVDYPFVPSKRREDSLYSMPLFLKHHSTSFRILTPQCGQHLVATTRCFIPTIDFLHLGQLSSGVRFAVRCNHKMPINITKSAGVGVSPIASSAADKPNRPATQSLI